VWIVHLSPIDEKFPILTGLSSALITVPYQMVANLDSTTLPTNVAFGATQAFLTYGTQSYKGKSCLCLERLAS
jgi:hypothetical protein